MNYGVNECARGVPETAALLPPVSFPQVTRKGFVITFLNGTLLSILNDLTYQ